ncbi:hypothetical protein SORBI_3005G027032 [Sorghum bicolor]|uniref:Uncharacterized protein n=1 Tax=Sorghum bicolor TaxID=4558 RepID=C5Y442_SORBI|nr:hypothetical protein SORBI_3005G027032 [Sorghum bicolor]
MPVNSSWTRQPTVPVSALDGGARGAPETGRQIGRAAPPATADVVHQHQPFHSAARGRSSRGVAPHGGHVDDRRHAVGAHAGHRHAHRHAQPHGAPGHGRRLERHPPAATPAAAAVPPPEGEVHGVAGHHVEVSVPGAARTHDAAAAGHSPRARPRPGARRHVQRVHRPGARVRLHHRRRPSSSSSSCPHGDTSGDVEHAAGAGTRAAVPPARCLRDDAPRVGGRVVLLHRGGARGPARDVDPRAHGGRRELAPREQRGRARSRRARQRVHPQRGAPADQVHVPPHRDGARVRGQEERQWQGQRGDVERGGGSGGVVEVEEQRAGGRGGGGGGDGEEAGAEAAARAAEVEECLGREEGGEAAAHGGERRERGAGHAGEDLEEELVGERGDGGLRLGVGVLGVGDRDRDGDGDRDGGVAGGVGGDAGPGEPREAARVAALGGHGWLAARSGRERSRSWSLTSDLSHCIPCVGVLGKATGHGRAWACSVFVCRRARARRRSSAEWARSGSASPSAETAAARRASGSGAGRSAARERDQVGSVEHARERRREGGGDGRARSRAVREERGDAGHEPR